MAIVTEEKTTHTPGPWQVSDVDPLAVRSEDYGGIAMVHAPFKGANHYRRDVERAQADARLIAAAPELLAALRVMVHLYRELAERTSEPFTNLPQLHAAEDAITKAEGR